MLRIALKGVRGHVLRFLLTGVAVVLGTAFVSGTFVLTDSIRKTFDDIVNAGSTGVDLQVRGTGGDTTTFDGTRIRTPLPVSLVEQLRQVDGVARAVPDYQGQALLVGKDGTAVRSGGAPSFGFAYYADDPALKLVEGTGPTRPGEVAAEASTLKRGGLKVGDRTQALIGGEPREVTISGEVAFQAGLAGATIIVLDEKTAAAAYAPDGTVQTFTLTAAKGVSGGELRDRVASVLPAGALAVTKATLADENRKDFGPIVDFIAVILLVFAFISVFVAAFLIANTFSMLVAQRTRELALLRAVGASRAQVTRVVLGEALVVGVVGSVAGLAAGLGLATALKALFGSFGLEISGGLPVHLRTVVITFAVGILVTVLAALFPALRASRVEPVVAMRDDVVAPAGGVRRRGLIGLALMVVGAAVVVPFVEREDVVWPLVGLGAFVVVIGAVVASPAATRPVVRVVAWPVTLLGGVVGRMARENSLRNPRRTAATATALMIGLAVMAAVSVVAASLKASVADIVEQQLTADLVLNGGGQVQFPPTVAAAVAKEPGVASVATVGGVQVEANGEQLFGIATTGRSLEQNTRLDVVSGSLAALDRGEVAVSQSTAKEYSWAVGTTIRATIGSAADRPYRIGAVIAKTDVLQGPQIIVPRQLYEQVVPVALQGDLALYVKASPGADVAALRSTLTELVKPYIVVSVQDGAEFTNSQADFVDQLLRVLYLLLALSILIAVVGVINTMALSVFERTREIGLLRAVGLSRRQLRRMITAESVATTVFGAVLGAVLGLALGIVLQRGLANSGLDVLAIPWLQIVVVIALAGVAGVVAAVIPAWRAVRMDVLRAISTD